MGSILVHMADENVTLSGRAAEKLLAAGNADAALLYIALLHRHGTVQPRALASTLRWDRSRIESAEYALREMGLLAPTGESVPEPAAAESWQQQDPLWEPVQPDNQEPWETGEE